VKRLPFSPLRLAERASGEESGSNRPEGTWHSKEAAPQDHERGESAPFRATGGDDLAVINQAPETVLRQWTSVSSEEWERLEAQVRRTVRVRDDFVSIPFPRLAAASQRQIAQAVEGYKKEAAVVDARLSRQVTLQAKGMALSDLCEGLREQTGIRLTAGRSAADDKVTVFCKQTPLREVMRQVNRLFSFTWLRSGKEGEYRYELQQDLRSQLLEEELRNRDMNAAMLALDAEMQAYRPFLDVSFEELQKRWNQISEDERRRIWERGGDRAKRRLSYLAAGGGWAGIQLYHRLTPRDRAALMAGQELVFRPEAPNPDRRIPAELTRLILQSMGDLKATVQYSETVDGQPVPLAADPKFELDQVRLWLDRPEPGRWSLVGTTAALYHLTSTNVRDGGGGGVSQPRRELATGRSPSLEGPNNAVANASLRSRPPFNRVVSLQPEPSCTATPNARRVGEYHPNFDRIADLAQPQALSSDVWEAVHRATGLPVIADFYTRLYPLPKVTVKDRPFFEALCAVGDTLGARWRKEGEFLLGRTTSYFWDRMQEVPNRYLQRWARSRETSGGLPFADFLEMATLSDQQLGGEGMKQGVIHYWGLREWGLLSAATVPPQAPYPRFLATLTPEQRRRALEPGGLPLRELTPAQRQLALQLQYEQRVETERQGFSFPPLDLEQFARGVIRAEYYPAGWYLALVPPESVKERPWHGPMDRVGGRTAEEARAAAARRYPRSAPQEVRQIRDGHFYAEIRL
jgi:hypothetical protein